MFWSMSFHHSIIIQGRIRSPRLRLPWPFNQPGPRNSIWRGTLDKAEGVNCPAMFSGDISLIYNIIQLMPLYLTAAMFEQE